MTDERLAELEKLANEATPGPWRKGLPHADGLFGVLGPRHWVAWLERSGGARDSKDATFIAAARTAVPELVAEMRRLRSILRGEDQATRAAAHEAYERHERVDGCEGVGVLLAVGRAAGVIGRTPGCTCDREEGDSVCPVHGEDG